MLATEIALSFLTSSGVNVSSSRNGMRQLVFFLPALICAMTDKRLLALLNKLVLKEVVTHHSIKSSMHYLFAPAAPCSYSLPVSAAPAVPFVIPLLLAFSVGS